MSKKRTTYQERLLDRFLRDIKGQKIFFDEDENKEESKQLKQF